MYEHLSLLLGDDPLLERLSQNIEFDVRVLILIKYALTIETNERI